MSTKYSYHNDERQRGYNEQSYCARCGQDCYKCNKPPSCFSRYWVLWLIFAILFGPIIVTFVGGIIWLVFMLIWGFIAVLLGGLGIGAGLIATQSMPVIITCAGESNYIELLLLTLLIIAGYIIFKMRNKLKELEKRKNDPIVVDEITITEDNQA